MPVSGEEPSRAGPRNVGQSAAPAAFGRAGAGSAGGASARTGVSVGRGGGALGAGSAQDGVIASAQASDKAGRKR